MATIARREITPRNLVNQLGESHRVRASQSVKRSIGFPVLGHENTAPWISRGAEALRYGSLGPAQLPFSIDNQRSCNFINISQCRLKANAQAPFNRDMPVLNNHVLKLQSFGLSLGPMFLKGYFYLSLPCIFKYISLLCIPLEHFESGISNTWNVY